MYKLVSVIIPVYNAESIIGACLDALLALDYPNDRLEIIVVDNGSTDNTAAIVDSYPLKRLSETRRGSYPARNKGIFGSRGEIIAFTDSDCIVEPDWVAEVNRSFRSECVDAVMGYTAGINANFWAVLEQNNFEEFWYARKGQQLILKRKGIDTRNSAIRRSVLAACGYFNADLPFCGDLDLSIRLRASNRRIVLNQRMRAHHRNRTELRPIMRIKRDHARAFIQITEQLSEGFANPHLPADFRRFLGIDNSTIQGTNLRITLSGIKFLQLVLILILRGFSLTMDTPNRAARKLFKSLCSVVWEIEILNARRRTNQPPAKVGGLE